MAPLPPAAAPASEAALLDGKAAATLLGISHRHLRRLADAGRMPLPLRLGSCVRWDRQLLLSWIAEGCPTIRNGR